MEPPYRPPNLFNDASDSDDAYVPSGLDKGKRKAEEPLDEEDVSRYRNSYHIHSQLQDVRVSSLDSDTDFGSDSDSELTPSPPLISIDAHRTTDDAGSDGDESFYQSVDEDNSSDDQMDVDIPPQALQRDEMDLAHSIKGMYRILDLISEQGSGGLGEHLMGFDRHACSHC
ncbi:hypothetical protein J3R82DRAFT_8304 [Butyriboletus roseoflavus]|nr:hypothetical protein J3R82DRAFT_8304 [Butyriboletus roseoflavus]